MRQIFMLQGLIIGLVGTVVGAVGGSRCATSLDRYRLDPGADGRLSDLLCSVHGSSRSISPSSSSSAIVDLLRRRRSIRRGQAGRARSGAGAAISNRCRFIEVGRPRRSGIRVRAAPRCTCFGTSTLSVERGEMVASSARQASGRARCCTSSADSTRSTAGTIRDRRRDLTAMTGDADAVAFRNRHVGFVFQFHHLLPEFSALENAEMPHADRAASPQPSAGGRAEALLARVGLGERLDAPARHAVGRRAAARRRRPRARDGSRACCSPTSRPATSTSTPPRPCTICSARCIASAASPRSSPRTIPSWPRPATACCGLKTAS